MAKLKQKEEPKIDALLKQYEEAHQNKTNKIIHWFCLPLILFGLIGLVSALPFPQLAFLGKYNMFINWFSFLLAIIIYYYLKLSPLLSYIMLLAVGVMYYFVVQLEYVEKAGGPALWQVSLTIFLIAIGLIIYGSSLEKTKHSFINHIKFLLWAPLFYLSLILKNLKTRG